MTTRPGRLDLLGIDSLFSQQERDMQASVRSLLDEAVRPELAQWYEAGSLPARELARQFGALGLLGMHLQGYGCAGTSATAYGLACLELEAADSGIRSLVSVQGSLAMQAIHAFGTQDQRQQWLPAMARGEAIGCFALTEPDVGSNPGGMRTRARRDRGDWVLSGTKMWITNGTIADAAVVWARTDDGIRGFLVPTDTPGLSAREVGRKLSLRASLTAELALEDVRLPAEALLPGAQGLRAPLSCLTEARFGIAFGAVGAARDCLEATLDYVAARDIFDKPLSAYQITQTKLADMATDLGTSMLLALHLGRLKDAGTLRPEQVSVGKLNNVRSALATARQCRTLLGANGITLDYPVMRHAANLETVLTYEGTSEVHQLVIGQALTGQAAFR